jgi:SH3-like domain-containing protein
MRAVTRFPGVRRAAFLAGLALFASGSAAWAEYRSIADGGTIMYDGPSTRAKRMFVATRGLPVEVISSDGTWVKVRDPSGDLTWVERKALSDKRTLLVSVPLADVRQRPEEQGSLVFQVAQGVALDLGDQAGVAPGWVRVRHRDGVTGFVRINQVWGL